MSELTYTNDQQIINDAAQMLIEAHMSWSGSLESKPSRDHERVGSKLAMAYIAANYTVADYNNLDYEQGQELEARAQLLFEKAKTLADKKWDAAMTLLGF